MEDKYLNIISKYLAGELADSEREELFEWVNSAEANKTAFQEMQELWEMSSEPEEEFEADVAVAWKKVAARTIEKQAKVIRYPWKRQLLRFAAVLLIGVLAGIWWFGQSPEIMTHQTLANEKTKVELPDGSIVWLNEKTKISYEEGFEPRIINLEGEAFFDVEHQDNQTFEIKSGETKTIVLGTTFNVRAYPEENQIEVTVESGKVAFENETQKEEKILLTAGHSGVFNKEAKKVNKQEKKISNADSWKTEKIAFSHTEMKQVQDALQRYFGIEIKVENEPIFNCHFDGTFNKPDLNVILEAMSYGMGLEIEKQGETIILKGKGCD